MHYCKGGSRSQENWDYLLAVFKSLQVVQLQAAGIKKNPPSKEETFDFALSQDWYLEWQTSLWTMEELRDWLNLCLDPCSNKVKSCMI